MGGCSQGEMRSVMLDSGHQDVIYIGDKHDSHPTCEHKATSTEN